MGYSVVDHTADLTGRTRLASSSGRGRDGLWDQRSEDE